MEPNYNQKDHKFSLKISILGPIAAGKSSILCRYSNNLFNPFLRTTINIDIITKIIPINQELIKLEIWDSPGDERYTPTTKACFRRAHGFFILFDLNDKHTFENCQSWVDEIRTQAHPDSVMILVGNKKDTPNKRVIGRDVAEQFQKDNHMFAYIETSALTGENVDAVFETIVREILNRLKNNKLKFPNLDGSLRLKEEFDVEKKSSCCLKK